jgi:hypothetical protein
MNYHRLSKEQFEELHEEFAKYLAALSIDRKEWEQIKANQPEAVEVHLDQFSDLVWEDVLSKDLYLEHLSPNHFFVFECLADAMRLIAVKLSTVEHDIMTKEGWQWLLHHIHDESVTIYRSTKAYDHDRKEELYGMILKGAQISQGDRFKSIAEFRS